MDSETFSISGPLLLKPRRHSDVRGVFSEIYNKNTFSAVCDIDPIFVQDNYSLSNQKGTVRALHGQKPPFAQGKLIQCINGRIRDVALDIRKSSPTYGQHFQTILSAENGAQLWVPEGFLHGFETLEDNTLVLYKQTHIYTPNAEISVLWNDVDLAIDWTTAPKSAILSQKDACAQSFKDFASPFE